MADAIRAANQGAGVLRLYGNYGGDVMNFDMAGDLVEMEDIETTTVLLADDVASAPPEEREKRRGVAGMVYAFKIAGAAAEAGRDLADVTRIAQKAADACRSVGVALSPCTVPQAGRPTFEIGEDEMEMGMGIHGEPGVWRDKLRPADAIADEMMDRCSPTSRSGPATASRCSSTASAPRRRRSSTSLPHREARLTPRAPPSSCRWSAATLPRWRWPACRSR